MTTILHEAKPGPEFAVRKIAVLTDFSRTAETALRVAASFARGYEASLVLAHAALPPSSALSAPTADLVYQALGAWRQGVKARLLSQIETLSLRDLSCGILFYEGVPGDLVKELGDADMIAVGTSGETGLKKIGYGSTAEVVVRSSAIPVLTVGPHAGMEEAEAGAFDTVLYATDFSPGAGRAIPYALSIAERYQAKLVLLHVLSGKDIKPPLESSASAESIKNLHRLVPEALDLKHTPTFVVAFGTPAEMILEQADRLKANLIVLGARGAGAFAAAVSHLRGGTAYRVAANAHCPVLTVPSPGRCKSKACPPNGGSG